MQHQSVGREIIIGTQMHALRQLHIPLLTALIALALAFAADAAPRDIPLDRPQTLQSIFDFKVFDNKVYLYDPVSAAATIKIYSRAGRFERGLLPGGYGEDSLFHVRDTRTGAGSLCVDADGFLVLDQARKAVLAFNQAGKSIGEYALPDEQAGSFGILRREGRVMAYGRALYLLSRDKPARELFSIPDGAGEILAASGGGEGKPYWLLTKDRLYRYSYFGLNELALELDTLIESFKVLRMTAGMDDGVVMLVEALDEDQVAQKLVALDRNGEQVWSSECERFVDMAESDGLVYTLQIDTGKLIVRLIGPRGRSNELFSLPLSGPETTRRRPLDLELNGKVPLVLAGDLDRGAVAIRVENETPRDLFFVEDLPPQPWLPGFSCFDDEFHIPCSSWEEGYTSRLRQMWVRRYSADGELKATLGREQVSTSVFGLAGGGEKGLLLFTGAGPDDEKNWLTMLNTEDGAINTLAAPAASIAEDYLIDHKNYAGMYGDRLLVSCPGSEDENMAVRLIDLDTGKHEALKKMAALDVRVLAVSGESIYVLWLDDIIYEVDADQKFVAMFDGFRERGLRLHETGRIRAAEALPDGGLILLDSKRMVLVEIPEEDFVRLPEFEFEEVEASILELQAALAAWRDERGNYPRRLSPDIVRLAEYVGNRTALLEPFIGERILSYSIVGGDELNYELYVLAGDREQEIWKIDRNAYLPY